MKKIIILILSCLILSSCYFKEPDYTATLIYAIHYPNETKTVAIVRDVYDSSYPIVYSYEGTNYIEINAGGAFDAYFYRSERMITPIEIISFTKTKKL